MTIAKKKAHEKSSRTISNYPAYWPEGPTSVKLGKKKVIDLWVEDPQSVAIVSTRSKIYWTNQVGGHACVHPVMEGIAIPLPNHWLPPVGELENIYYAPYNADLVDKWLALNDLSKQYFQAIRRPCKYTTMMHEAWIAVQITEKAKYSGLEHFVDQVAILTWENSD